MKALKQEFPHPLLAEGRDDYRENCKFNTAFEPGKIIVDDDHIIIPIEYQLICDSLEELLTENKVRPIISVYCGEASYSRIFDFPKHKTKMEVKIPKYDVINKLEIEGMLLANTYIDQFSSDEFNQNYFGGAVFKLRKGDIMAGESTRIIYLDASELEKPLSSIFTIRRIPDQKEGIRTVFELQKIQINLNEELYQQYIEYKEFNQEDHIRYFNGVIIFPALVGAVSIMKEVLQGTADSYLRGNLWYRSIEYQLKKQYPELKELPKDTNPGETLSPYDEKLLNILIDSTASANLLLDDIANRAMSSLRAVWADLADADQAELNG